MTVRGGAVVVRPDPETQKPLPHAIEGYTAEEGPYGPESRLRIFYWGGVEECWRLGKVDSREGPDVVIVTVYEGSAPDLAPDTACIQIAVLKAVEVDLKSPLDGRLVLDGARQAR